MGSTNGHARQYTWSHSISWHALCWICMASVHGILPSHQCWMCMAQVQRWNSIFWKHIVVGSLHYNHNKNDMWNDPPPNGSKSISTSILPLGWTDIAQTIRKHIVVQAFETRATQDHMLTLIYRLVYRLVWKFRSNLRKEKNFPAKFPLNFKPSKV